MREQLLHVIEYASGLAGASSDVAKGPAFIRESAYLNHYIPPNVRLLWHQLPSVINDTNDFIGEMRQLVLHLANKTAQCLRQQEFFCVLGGDHTSAIGTWSGVYDVLHQRGDVGLIWIDAHMDSHTPETSESGRLHGMPLAILLGQGCDQLTSILHPVPKFKPDNICLIGVRSYEKGEAEFLKKLNVRIYFMDEIKSRGLTEVMKEAVELVSANTIAYGLSLDIDSVDPKEAPGVDVPEPNGLNEQELCTALKYIASDFRLVGAEIVEFNPKKDQHHLTEKFALSVLNILAEGQFSK